MLDYAETLGINKKHNNSVFVSKNAQKSVFFWPPLPREMTTVYLTGASRCGRDHLRQEYFARPHTSHHFLFNTHNTRGNLEQLFYIQSLQTETPTFVRILLILASCFQKFHQLFII